MADSNDKGGYTVGQILPAEVIAMMERRYGARGGKPDIQTDASPSAEDSPAVHRYMPVTETKAPEGTNE